MKRELLWTLVFSSLSVYAMASHPTAMANQPIDASSQIQSASAQSSNGQSQPALMDGFSTDRQGSVGMSCLKPGAYDFVGNSKVVIDMGDAIDFKDIQKYLDVDVTREGDIELFSQDPAASYARYIRKDQYSEAFYYIERVKLPTKRFQSKYFQESALNAIGLQAYHAGPDQFRWSCGDQYIQQTPLGANLFVTLKLNFNRMIDKKNFDDHVGGSIGSILTAGDDLQKLVTQYHIQGNLDIAAYQVGGDPLRLGNIFKKSQEGYYATNCRFNNLDACKQVISNVLNYAQKDFSNQIAFKDGKVTGNAAALDYSYQPYLSLGLTVGQSLVTRQVLDARLKLSSLYQESLPKLAFVNHLLSASTASLFTEPYKSRLVQAAADLNYNIGIFKDPYNGAIACYLQPDRCVAIANTIQGDLKPIDNAIINYYKGGYSMCVTIGQKTVLYYAIPLGGNQYYSVLRDTFEPAAYQMTLKSADAGNTLTLDIVDVQGKHITGTLHKVSSGVYQGDQIYPDGPHFTTLSLIQNPL